jgi:hypothetical protein
LEEIRPETALSPGPSRDNGAGVPSTNGEGTPEMELLIWWPESLGNRRGDYFWFGSVFIKKSNQTEI